MRRRTLRTRDGFRLSALEWEWPAPSHDDPPPLLCLPGISRNALDFDRIGAWQSARRRVVALDYLGHGESERPPSPGRYNVAEAVRDLLDAMAALHLHRVVVLGTSFGGILAMALGVFRPGTLAGVVLNDVGPALAGRGLDKVRDLIGRDPAHPDLDTAASFLQERLPPLDVGEMGWRGFAERTYAIGEDGRWHPRWDIRIVQAMAGEDGGVPPQLWPFFLALDHVPVQLVWGEESELLTTSTIDAMRRARPDLDLVALPGIGHAPVLEDPEARAGIARFLERVA